jgi:hypothetical protein
MYQWLVQKGDEVWAIVRDQFEKYPQLRLAVLSLGIVLVAAWVVKKLIL